MNTPENRRLVETPPDMFQVAIDTLMAKGTPFATGLAAEIDRGRRRADRESARRVTPHAVKRNKSAWARLGERVRRWMAPKAYEPEDGEKVWFWREDSPRPEFDWMPGIVHRPLTPDREEYIIWLEGDPMRGRIASAGKIRPYV